MLTNQLCVYDWFILEEVQGGYIHQRLRIFRNTPKTITFEGILAVLYRGREAIVRIVNTLPDQTSLIFTSRLCAVYSQLIDVPEPSMANKCHL